MKDALFQLHIRIDAVAVVAFALDELAPADGGGLAVDSLDDGGQGGRCEFCRLLRRRGITSAKENGQDLVFGQGICGLGRFIHELAEEVWGCEAFLVGLGGIRLFECTKQAKLARRQVERITQVSEFFNSVFGGFYGEFTGIDCMIHRHMEMITRLPFCGCRGQ